MTKHKALGGATEWPELLPFATFAHNISPIDATGYAPFHLFYGRQPLWPELPITNESYPYYTQDKSDYLQTYLEYYTSIVAEANESLEQNREKMSTIFDRKATVFTNNKFHVGDYVYLSKPKGSVKKSLEKLTPRVYGPYRIRELRKTTVVLEDLKGREIGIYPMDRLVKISGTLAGPCMLMKNRDKNVNLSWCKTRFHLYFRPLKTNFRGSYTYHYHKVRLKILPITTKPLIYCEFIVNCKLFMFRSILSSSYTYHIRDFILITLLENLSPFYPSNFHRIHTYSYHKVKLKVLQTTTKSWNCRKSLLNHELFIIRQILMNSNLYHTHRLSPIILSENFVIFCPFTLTLKQHLFSHQTSYLFEFRIVGSVPRCFSNPQTIRPFKFYVIGNFPRKDKREIYDMPEGKWQYRKKKRQLIYQQINFMANLKREGYRLVKSELASLNKFILYFIPYKASNFERKCDSILTCAYNLNFTFSVSPLVFLLSIMYYKMLRI